MRYQSDSGASAIPEQARKFDWTKVLAKHQKVRIVPSGLTTEENRALYAGLCGIVMRLCKDVNPDATALVSCDEAHNILKQHDFPTPCERLITGGRKHGVECVYISQRPALLHTTVISQADRRVYFAVSDDNDITKIKKVASFSADDLKDLPERRCIVENKDSGKWGEVDTNEISRVRPHYSGDDGIIDGHLPV